MKYLMLVCQEGPIDASPEELDAGPWVEDTQERGVRLFGDRIAEADAATTVRVRDGRTVLTEGPYVHAKEQLCGFDVLECSGLDEALDVARRHPMARFGMIEVRPFWTP